MNKHFVASVGAAVSVLGFSIAVSPSAAADTCPYDMSTAAGQQALADATVAASQQASDLQSQINAAGGDQTLANQQSQIQAENSRVVLACTGNLNPDASQALANNDQAVANSEAIQAQVATDEAAMNAPTPGVLPNGQPDCGYYQARVDSLPKPVDIAFLALPPIFDPQNVVLVCGLANSVSGGVSMVTGDVPGSLESGQQANQAFCDTGIRVFDPLFTLPIPC